MMRRTLATLSVLYALSAGAAAPEAALATREDLQRVCEEFYEIDLDAARVHDVTGAVLVRDIGTLRLNKGVLIFSQAIEGVTPIAVFRGEGTFTVSPVRRMDRRMLDIAAKEHLNKELGGMINTGLTEAVFVSYEKTWDELKSSLSAPRTAAPQELERARAILKDRLEVLDTVAETPELGLIIKAIAEPSEEVALRTEIKTTDLGWIFFNWRPARTYEVEVGTREPVGAYYMIHPLVTTHRKRDHDPNGRYVADPVADLHELIRVKRYRMDVEIPDLQQINVDVDVTFAPQTDGMRLVTFNLINDLIGPRWDSRAKWVDVKSITDEAGNELPFVHRKQSVSVLLREKVPKGKDVKLNFKLNENTVIQFSNVHWLMLNTYPWFPQYGYLGGQYEIDWTIKTVKPLTSTGSGKTVKSWEEGKFNAVQMIFERPVQFPSIIFGRYQAERGDYDSLASGQKIPLAAHYWPLTIFKLTDPTICRLLNLNCPVDREVQVPANKPPDVISEGKEIIKFMESLYGPFPYEKLDVAMMAPGLGFGQAPPSFVQLTGEAFMSSAVVTSDFFHGFYSHEIAHQWWGHKVGWLSDEDQWLSEAFAEYSSGLYVMNLMEKKRFKQMLREWRKGAKFADDHGSIAWANNISGPLGGAYRYNLIYNKGAHVVHMLRMQMGIDNFKKAMQNVFTKYGYTNITTDMLKRECELVVGYNLDFFFDQWFRDNGIPVFDYSWKAEAQPDGKYLVTVKISQRDKENFKQVLMPVYFYFQGQKEPLIKPRPVLKAEDVYQVKLPQKPSQVVLDEDQDLLADIILQEGASAQ
jgi:hypothetical protein